MSFAVDTGVQFLLFRSVRRVQGRCRVVPLCLYPSSMRRALRRGLVLLRLFWLPDLGSVLGV